MISEKLMSDPSPTPISGPGDSPVRTFPSPGKEQACDAERGRVFSTRSCGLLKALDRSTLSWKTCATSSRTGLKRSSRSLPASGMMRSGRLFQREPWAPRTSESGSGLWPTPMVSDAEGGKRPIAGTTRSGRRPDGKKAQVGLAYALALAGEEGLPNPGWVELMMGYPSGWTDPTFGPMTGSAESNEPAHEGRRIGDSE